MILTEEMIQKRLYECYSEKHIDIIGTSERSYFVDPNSELKCAAVLIPLTYQKPDWFLVYTRRTEHVDSHKGQVSFPGGGCEPEEEQPEQTALRETWEEIGIKASDVNILGRLNSIITITNFSVTPVVGIIPWNIPFNLSRKEVSRVFRIPLPWLAQSSNWEEQKYFVEGMKKDHSVIKYHPYDGEILWGATARITHNFLRTINLIQ